MSDYDTYPDMTPEERMRQAASILATGILRLRRCSISSAKTNSKNVPKLSPEGLEFPEKPRLSVRVG